MVTWWCGEILANTAVSEKLYTSVLAELKRQQNSIISDLVSRNYFTNNSFKVGDQVRIQTDVGSGNNGRVKVGDFIYYEPIEFMYQRRYISELHGVDSVENVKVDYRHFGSYYNQLYIDYILTSDDTKNTKNNEGVELPSLYDIECEKDYSAVEVQFGKALSVYQELVAKYNRYAKLLILDSEYDERVVDECNKRILQLAYYSLGNEQIKWKFALGWANVAFGDWKGRLNISAPNQFFFNSSIEILNSETNDWEKYEGDKNILELDFENMIKESDSRVYLESMQAKLEELKTQGMSIDDNGTSVALGATTALMATGYKTMTLEQVLNLGASELVGTVGKVKDSFQGIYTELAGMTSVGVSALSQGLQDVIVTLGTKFFIPFLTISPTLDAPDLIEPETWVHDNEQDIKDGNVENIANTLKVISSELMQQLAGINQAVQSVAESTSQAISKELQEVEMKVQPLEISEGSAIGIDASALENAGITVDASALVTALENAGIAVDATALTNALSNSGIVVDASSLDNKKITVDSSSLANSGITIDASALDNASITATVEGALTIAPDQVVDANMVLGDDVKGAIIAQGTRATNQENREADRIAREEAKEERDKVAHDVEYNEKTGARRVEGENAVSAKDVLWDGVEAVEGTTTGDIIAPKGVLSGLKMLFIPAFIRELHSKVMNENVADLARAKRQDDEDDDDFKNRMFPNVHLESDLKLSDNDEINKAILESLYKIKIKRGINGIFTDLMTKIKGWVKF